MSKIEFWFSIGSTYTYLSTQRLEALEKEKNVEFEWFPFSVRARMVEMENIVNYNSPRKPDKNLNVTPLPEEIKEPSGNSEDLDDNSKS